MKKPLFIILAIIVVGIFWIIGQYNSLIAGQAWVWQAWANVEAQYQRRADLVPQLVATVQGAADFEQKTLTDVVEARAKATSVQVNPNDANSIQAFTASQGELSGALSRLLVSVEAYPNLTATPWFRDLQSQLEGTENRISVARGDYNTAVTSWNVRITRIPTVILARLLGFDKATLFDAAPGSDVVPKIQFDFQKK